LVSPYLLVCTSDTSHIQTEETLIQYVKFVIAQILMREKELGRRLRPVAILLDNHDSRLDSIFTTFCEVNQDHIRAFSEEGMTSGIFQPFDQGNKDVHATNRKAKDAHRMRKAIIRKENIGVVTIDNADLILILEDQFLGESSLWRD